MSYALPKGYWQRRANLCTEFADEGECLAQVARHAPVTIGGMGDTAQDVSTAISVTAQLFSNPDAAMRRYGPPIVAAVDQHVVDPVIDKIGESLAPYLIKYMIPPLTLLYIVTGISAYYSYQTARRVRPNRSRRRRRRSSRRN